MERALPIERGAAGHRPVLRAAPGPYTWDDFVVLAEDDGRELIDGHLIEVEVPTQLHELIVVRLVALLELWAEAHEGGDVLASGYKVRINLRRGVMPDVQYFRPGRLPSSEQQGLVSGRPDLAVEVVSPSSRAVDRVTKLNWYARKGVPEYWIVDPEERTLERHVLRDRRYFVEPFSEQSIFAPDSFPGLRIALSRLWKGPRGRKRARSRRS